MPKPIAFDYKPRYWDQAKEEREARQKRLDALQSGDVEGAKTRIAEAFSRGAQRKIFTGDRRRENRRSNFLFLGIIILLAVIAYLALNVYLPRTGLYFE